MLEHPQCHSFGKPRVFAHPKDCARALHFQDHARLFPTMQNVHFVQIIQSSPLMVLMNWLGGTGFRILS